MNLLPGEIGAIVVGLLIGYWAIGAVLRSIKNDPEENPELARAKQRKAGASSAPHAPPAGGAAQPWYQVLGISSGASITEIKLAYRQKITQYHPDKVASLGEEIRHIAEHMSRQITVAYREGMQRNGVES